MDVLREIEDIGNMLDSASRLMLIRKEVAAVMKDGFVVTDGVHQEGGEGCEVVVRCGSNGDMVTRRLRESVPDMDISRIADGIIGLNRSRRK